MRRALLSRLGSVGKYHTDTANILNDFSFLLMEQARVKEAEALARASMEISDTIGYRHDTNAYVNALLRRSAALFVQQRYEEAKESYAAVDAAIASWPHDHRVGPRTPWARIFTHYYTGEAEKGIALAREAYERSRVAKEGSTTIPPLPGQQLRPAWPLPSTTPRRCKNTLQSFPCF